MDQVRVVKGREIKAKKGGRTETSRGNVGCNHNGRSARLELLENPVSLLLLLVSVDSKRRPSAAKRKTKRRSDTATGWARAKK